MMDAASAGLPIVVGDKIKAVDRYEGNGLTYVENDPISLAERLITLQDPQLRARLGKRGSEKMRAGYSVDRVIDVLLADYEAAIGKK